MPSKIAEFVNGVLKPFGAKVVRRPGGRSTLLPSHSYSSADEEHILQRFVGEIAGVEKVYVDIGAGDGVSMGNTVRLALNGWRGFCFECHPEKVAILADLSQDYKDVKVCQAKITPDNVCSFLRAYDVPENFGVLNLDIDSYDYFVLQEILSVFRPSIIVVEINEKIPPPLEFTVLFDPDSEWDSSHFYGQSLSQLEKLCIRYRYDIAWLEYNNVFLIPTDIFKGKRLSAEDAYRKGYLMRGDRKERFPWNEDMECLIEMNPLDGVFFLKNYFAAYEGKYSLSISERNQTSNSL